ncbi:hypothetical protein LINPERHAP1_LOCUS12549 [Linum perenne]
MSCRLSAGRMLKAWVDILGMARAKNAPAPGLCQHHHRSLEEPKPGARRCTWEDANPQPGPKASSY